MLEKVLHSPPAAPMIATCRQAHNVCTFAPQFCQIFTVDEKHGPVNHRPVTKTHSTDVLKAISKFNYDILIPDPIFTGYYHVEYHRAKEQL